MLGAGIYMKEIPSYIMTQIGNEQKNTFKMLKEVVLKEGLKKIRGSGGGVVSRLVVIVLRFFCHASKLSVWLKEAPKHIL